MKDLFDAYTGAIVLLILLVAPLALAAAVLALAGYSGCSFPDGTWRIEKGECEELTSSGQDESQSSTTPSVNNQASQQSNSANVAESQSSAPSEAMQAPESTEIVVQTNDKNQIAYNSSEEMVEAIMAEADRTWGEARVPAEEWWSYLCEPISNVYEEKQKTESPTNDNNQILNQVLHPISLEIATEQGNPGAWEEYKVKIQQTCSQF